MAHLATFGRGSNIFVGGGGTQEAISFGAILIPDVEHAHARIVIGGEDRLFALERARTVFVQIVRTEIAELAIIAAVGGRRQGRDRHRIFVGAHVDHPGVEQSLRAIIRVGFIGDDGELAARQAAAAYACRRDRAATS